MNLVVQYHLSPIQVCTCYPFNSYHCYNFMTEEDANVHRYYRGKRAKSFYPQDVNELMEIRAMQRTFDGAYSRSALGSLGYALTVLRLFDKRFRRIGIIYTVLAAVFYVLAFVRQRHAMHGFADRYREENSERIVRTVGQTGKQVYGRPFVTAGWIVIAVTIVVASVEISFLVLVFQV
ncbi:hypothetical protein AcW1_007594 [Taiwanofungus camphoratus]|nr:hypothetical protein AcV7_009798 [Antrodia cinnamomea]KAI0953354.1 hypothetical protein AcW1_007594 [Antrodia cinnamomea]